MMRWNQAFPRPDLSEGRKVKVAIQVDSWSDDTNRQMSRFIEGIIRSGCLIDGGSEVPTSLSTKSLDMWNTGR